MYRIYIVINASINYFSYYIKSKGLKVEKKKTKIIATKLNLNMYYTPADLKVKFALLRKHLMIRAIYN